MSFIGTPVVEQINANLLRITGISLAAEVSGTIGLSGATGTTPDITLPASFSVPEILFEGQVVSLASRIQVRLEPVSAGPLTNLPPSIAKTGTTPQDFRVTITNTNEGLQTQDLEIYVESVPKGGKGRVNVAPVINVVIGGDAIDLG